MLSLEEKKFIREHLTDDVRQLALHMKPLFLSESNIPFILRQIAGRQQIKNKAPSWYLLDDIVYPSRVSLEQCSSETTAKYKASLLAGNSFVDLTGGFGVDTVFISQRFVQADYVEKQSETAQIAKHNFAVLGLNIGVHIEDGRDYLRRMKPVDWIYLDPARRSIAGEKVARIEDCEPNLLEIQDLLLEKASQVLLKLSPMLDIKSALNSLKGVKTVHVASVENECKELLFILQKGYKAEPLITCLNFGKNDNKHSVDFYLSEEKNTVISYACKIGTFLYEPHVSLLKAGYYKGIANRYCLNKLHPDSHLYTSSELAADFPGRIFHIENMFSLNKREIKEALNGIDKAHVSVRNFPLSVVELRKKLKMKEGGESYLFATTLADGTRKIIKGSALNVLRSTEISSLF